MKDENHIFTLALVAVFLCGSITTYAFQEWLTIQIMQQNPTGEANVEYVFECFDGTRIIHKHNVITDISENHTRNAFAYGNEQNASCLTVGNASGTLQTKTVLDAVYDDPTDGQYIYPTPTIWLNSGDAAYNVTFKWTFEETVNLNSSALYLGNTTYAYAIAQFPAGSQGFSSGENLTVTWTVTYDAND